LKALGKAMEGSEMELLALAMRPDSQGPIGSLTFLVVAVCASGGLNVLRWVASVQLGIFNFDQEPKIPPGTLIPVQKSVHVIEFEPLRG
ncbi:hypothetical protein, partial [Gelidibacter salicanalis]|uniref:hypothetical protein n=1 Tax=Gelidibacter salicanalis TaxID=291193 RepID=UPI001F36B899